MPLHLYNTLTRAKSAFEPADPQRVTMYVCGPTVYASAHIGHAMSYLVFDMVRRYLEHRGYRVLHAQNFTDVDDKIIKSARESGESAEAITARYIGEFVADMDALNVQRAHVYPHASLEIPAILSMIEGLIAKGHAYESEGDVYFLVPSDDDYGKLSNRRLDEQQAGSRVSDAERDRKEHPLDFALWKAAKAGEVSWPSPWGAGRPGWHIECSAMARRYLGDTIDIHGGGADLIFPHHENEIAQSECFTGHAPFARYWLHNGLLQIDDEKMSKSLKNVFAIAAFLERHSADALRLFVLSTHYRRPVAYSEESFGAAERAMDRLRAALQPARVSATEDEPVLDALANDVEARFHAAMDDDLNSANALAALFELARALNGARDGGRGGPAFGHAQATLRRLLLVLGFRLDDPSAGAQASDAAPFIDLLVETRRQLRAAKQWALADQLRDQLGALGVTLEDTPGGTKWSL